MTEQRQADLAVKRIYDPPAPGDGFRVLVDRLWPRGLNKGSAHLDLWLKDIAPSRDLRAWFNHQPARYAEFKQRYHRELDESTVPLRTLKEILSRYPRVTLLYGARDDQYNNAIALKDYLRRPHAARHAGPPANRRGTDE